MNNVKVFLLLACVVALTGCATGQGLWDYLLHGNGGNYKKYYYPMPEMTPERIAELRAAPPTEMPLIQRTQMNERGAATVELAEHGFVEIGSSFFEQCTEYSPETKDALVHARLIGADLALVAEPQYLNKTYSWTEDVYEDEQVYVGNDKDGKPIYETRSVYVRTDNHTCYYYDYGAEFFIKAKPDKLGSLAAASTTQSAPPLSPSALPADAGHGEELVAKNICNACHAVDKARIGPSYQDIAAKYAGNATAPAQMAERIKKGSSGVWGAVTMPPQPNISDEDIKAMVGYVMSQKKQWSLFRYKARIG
ncbi:MAG: c-type cytochrome [Burkholderiales bacterium]|jgi:cytochrome c|nr:c-type cytochrome [Burkholderiales bacterium]